MMADKTKKAMPDHDSDPARTPGDGWVGEGGASHLGPATHLASGSDEEDPHGLGEALESDDDSASGDNSGRAQG